MPCCLTILTLKASNTTAQGQRSGLPVGRQAQPRSATLGLGKENNHDPVGGEQTLVGPFQGSSCLPKLPTQGTLRDPGSIA